MTQTRPDPAQTDAVRNGDVQTVTTETRSGSESTFRCLGTNAHGVVMYEFVEYGERWNADQVANHLLATGREGRTWEVA